MTSADPNVAVGNDVDSMYGIRAYQTSTGDYLISKDNYNENSIVIHRMTVVPTSDFSISFQVSITQIRTNFAGQATPKSDECQFSKLPSRCI